MNDMRDRSVPLPEDDWMRVWQENTTAADPEKMARTIMTHIWRFDQKIFWRNAREYAAGIVLLVVFAGQLVLGRDRVGGLVGISSVGFVMAYLWWKHRGLQPLDPTANAVAYKAALLARVDEQISLLRSMTYWYLLPLSLPAVWQAFRAWSSRPLSAIIILLIVLAGFAAIGWLNVVWGVRALRAKRANVESMFLSE
jgi:hypothetical protein